MRGAGARRGLSWATVDCRRHAWSGFGHVMIARQRRGPGGVGKPLRGLGGARRGDDAGARSEPWAAARLGGAKPTARLTRRADPRTEAGRRRHTPEELPSVLSERPLRESRSQVDERHVAGWGVTLQPAAAAASDPAPRAAPGTAVAWEAGPAWSPAPPTHVGGRQVQTSWAGKGDQRPIHTHPFTVCRERGAEAS